MRADVSDPGRRGDLGDGPVDAVVPDALAVFEEQVAAAQAGWSAGEPLVEEGLQLRVQENVAVVDAMSLVGGAGAAGWWSWTISPDGVSWSCSNCVTIFTRTT